MNRLGSLLFTIGAAAIIMNILNYRPTLLLWMYEWGEVPAWIIKISLLSIGTLLFWLSEDDKTRTHSILKK